MTTPHFITALATPLRKDDSLHKEGLESEIDDAIRNGINGLFVGGSMGAMQMLSDATYRELMSHAASVVRDRAELLAGIGDTSLARTRDRLLLVNTLRVDAVVVLTPYVEQFSQLELIDYYTELADLARAPLFLYDLPQVSKTKLQRETVLRLSKHPNIRGIKCSHDPAYARQLRDSAPDSFRVILAFPLLLDSLLRHGLMEHLDGVFCLCPGLVAAIGQAAVEGDWNRAAVLQHALNAFYDSLLPDGVWRPFTALMHHRGVMGQFNPRPYHPWTADEEARYLSLPETVRFLEMLEELEGESVRSLVHESDAQLVS